MVQNNVEVAATEVIRADNVALHRGDHLLEPATLHELVEILTILVFLAQVELEKIDDVSHV